MDIYSSEGSPQTIYIYQSSERPNWYIYIGGLSTNKILILIQGLGECERVGEDSGSELVM